MMVNNLRSIINIQFDQAQQPKFKEKYGSGYVEFGDKNNYSNYLIDLFAESPKHGAIVKGKTNYIFGKGFEEVPKKANSKGESWNDILKKSVLDDELHGGYYLQIIYNTLGNIADVYHLPFQNVRVSKDLQTFYVKNDWDKSQFKEKMRVYPAFNLNDRVGSQILYVKQYNPKSEVYPLPSYFQGLNYIESDIQVSRHLLGNAKHNFVATKLINFNNGLPQEEEQGEVEADIKKKFGNHDGDRFVISFNPSKENAVDIQNLGETSLTKEDFTNVNTLIQQEIFSAHQITSSQLFGIPATSVFSRNELRDSYTIFNNTYVNARQQDLEVVFSKLMNEAGIEGEWKIVPVEPLSFEFSENILAANMTRAEIREKLGLKPEENAALPTTTTPTPMGANDSIKNLSGRQYQGVMRIVRQFTSGKLNKNQASLMLKSGFGFNDEDVNTFLGIDDDPKNEFAALQDDVLLQEFANSGEDKMQYNEIDNHSASSFFKFAVDSLSTTEANILDLMSKDKRITDEVIAKILKMPVEEVTTIVNKLVSDNLIKVTESDRTLAKPLDEIKGGNKSKSGDIVIRYTYAGPEDAKNRPFCARMLDIAKRKVWSRSDIENISMRLGYSVWDRRGGWYTLPGTNEHRPYCRHEWKVLILKRK